MKTIDINEFVAKPVDIWMNGWFALCAGNMKEFNAMTVAWGSIGNMWSKPFMQVVVRPSRYTFEFMNRFDTFTICAFPEKYREALQTLGTKSGRDCDKITLSGLTVKESELVEAPCFEEARLVIECRKMYWQDMNPDNFLNEEFHSCYPGSDYHRIYYGEILNISEKE